MRKLTLLLILLPTIVGAAQSPYAGWEARSIKALSAQQIDDLREGRGRALALPANLKGWPRPKHIIDVGAQLQLSTKQARSIQASFAAMQQDAREAGIKVLEAEEQLEQRFAERSVDADSLTEAVRAAGERWSQLRTIHLKYHLSMMSILTPDQHQRYQQLRGYTNMDQQHHGGHQQH